MQTQLITARRLGWLCGVLYCTQLQAATVSCTNLESWLASKAYNGGSTVQHEQKAYKANWWNQNKNPAQYANPYQEWTKQGDCEGVVANQPPQVSLTAPAAGSSHSAGTVVTLRAVADEGSVLTGWSGATCTGTGTHRSSRRTASVGSAGRPWVRAK